MCLLWIYIDQHCVIGSEIGINWKAVFLVGNEEFRMLTDLSHSCN